MDPLNALIAQLDPARDYGGRSFAEVVALVREGAIGIEPGVPVPRLTDPLTHKFLPGSGGSGVQVIPPDQLRQLAQQQRDSGGRSWFESRVLGTTPDDDTADDGTTSDRDVIYNRCMFAIRHGTQGWTKIAEFMLTQYVGKPRETASSKGVELVELLLTRLGEGTTARLRMIDGVPVVVE